jgi:hypothetical protein
MEDTNCTEDGLLHFLSVWYHVHAICLCDMRMSESLSDVRTNQIHFFIYHRQDLEFAIDPMDNRYGTLDI